MSENVHELELETRTIGPLILTTPVLQKLGLREIVNNHCEIAEQGDLDHGLVAELVTQCRLSDPRALYDMVDWGDKYDIAALYPDIEHELQLNDDRIGRMLDEIYSQRSQIWGELVGKAASEYQLELQRLHADSMPIKFAGEFAGQGSDEKVPQIEPGYNPQGEWVNQLKLFAMSAGDSGIPVWFETLSGGAGDSPAYVPEFEALCKYAELSTFLPLDEVILIGDRKMATKENQLTWLRQNIGFIGPQTMTEANREILRNLLEAGEKWTKSDYVAQREQKKAEDKRNVYHYLGQTVSIEDTEDEEEKQSYPVRQLYVRSAALAVHESKRRQQQMEAIESEIQRIAGIVNKYDYKTVEITAARVQKKAFKNRSAQKYFTFKVEDDKNNMAAPLRLTYTIDQQKVEQDAEMDGVYMLVAGSKAATLNDNEILKEWKGQYKVEHRFRMIQEIFLAHPIFLKKPERIVSLIFLIMVGSLVAGLVERQVRRAVTEQEEPIKGLMPEGRDTLRPTIGRILKAFAHYSLIRFKEAGGKIVRRQFAKLDVVQQQILALLGLPEPAQIFGTVGLT